MVTAEQRVIESVVVTGGASGLGAAVADAVVKAGGTAIVLDRKETVDHPFLRVDLADPRAAEGAVREAGERFGISAVVTCAGVDVPGSLLDVAPADWERVVAVNLVGTAAVVRAALPHLLDRRGRVVTVASTLGRRAVADATAYCASKFGVVGFTRALAAETKGRLAVTLLIPGGMQTAFFDEREERYRPAPGTPLSDPAAVADVVLTALTQPDGCEIKEMLVAGPEETSWP